MSFRLLFGGLAALAVVAVASLTYSYFALRQNYTAEGPLVVPVTVDITPGMTLSKAAQQLESAGVLRSAWELRAQARLFAPSEPIKAGEYDFTPGASPQSVLLRLQSGDVVLHRLTIPEGTPAVLVHEMLLAEDKLNGDIPVPAEGSVLPETYRFQRGQERKVVLEGMQQAMRDLIGELWPQRAAGLPLKTPREAIILASVVEKEAGNPDEYGQIAGVFVNRLRLGMRLEADPTVIYPVTKGKPLRRRIRLSELRAENDYNTYTRDGLPAGPIAMPGRGAIEAVLNPAKTDAIFFVADGSGGHVFARTLAEHERNVANWRQLRREREF